MANATSTPPAMRAKLLALAREAIVKADDPVAIAKLAEHDVIEGEGGVFVSVYVDEDLRGCIGNLTGVDLQEGIIGNAIHAAYDDSRFAPIQPHEFKRMKVHINLLTAPEPLAYSEQGDLMRKIAGLGVILRRGGHEATFLPSVWEQLPEPAEFLSHLCQKAGLSSDDWKRPGLHVQVYASEEFSE
jgi:AmmeMemoRadiSam system protein A